MRSPSRTGFPPNGEGLTSVPTRPCRLPPRLCTVRKKPSDDSSATHEPYEMREPGTNAPDADLSRKMGRGEEEHYINDSE